MKDDSYKGGATDPLDTGLLTRSRVRLVRQSEVAECGLACLAMVANYHGYDIDLASMRRRYPPSPRGAPLRTLIDVADRLQMMSRPVKLPIEQLPNLAMPAVLHWDMNHYVVLERVRGRQALIHDPDGRSRWMPLAEVSDHFTGVALELSPGKNFQPGRERAKVRWSDLWSRLTGIKRALLQVLVLSLVIQAYVLALPYYTQIAVDTVLPAQDANLLIVLALGFGLFTLLRVGATFLRSFVLLTAGSRLGFGISSNVARHLFRLPVDWFARRQTGDILSRFQSVDPIRTALTEGTVAALVDGLLAMTTLAILFFYSAMLASVAVLALLGYMAVRIVSFSFQRQAQEAAIVAGGKEQTTLIESMQGIAALRLFNRETARHTLWQGRLADETNAQIRMGRINVWQQGANGLLFGVENVVTIYLAIRLVLDGGFSVGMVFAYIAYKQQFLERSAALLDQTIAFFMLRLHLERLSDITLAEEDASFGESIDTRTELRGAIELREVTYRYSPTDPFVLHGIDLRVEAGEHVAITGPSGAGKSTLLKIMLGLVEPTSGEVLVDGVPLVTFGYKSLHDQVAAVLQEDMLFTGSIGDNVALFDDAPDTGRIEDAARAAAIHDDIMAMPMRYETLVGDLGSSLSGGQKQRVLLARALYRRPRMLFMDEGTSHLDAANEARVNVAVRDMGITRIVIAHRNETVDAADRVLRFEGGRIVG